MITMSTCQVHVQCLVHNKCIPVDKFLTYVIRLHVDQNAQESRTTARVTKENGLFNQEKGLFLLFL